MSGSTEHPRREPDPAIAWETVVFLLLGMSLPVQILIDRDATTFSPQYVELLLATLSLSILLVYLRLNRVRRASDPALQTVSSPEAVADRFPSSCGESDPVCGVAPPAKGRAIRSWSLLASGAAALRNGRLVFLRPLLELLAFLVLLSCINSPLPLHSLIKSIKWLPFIGICLALPFLSCRRSNAGARFGFVVVAGLCIYLIYYIIMTIQIADPSRISKWDVPIIGYIRAFGIIVGTGAVISGLWLFHTRSTTERAACFLLAVGFAAVVLWSGSRTPLFAAAASLLVLGWVNPRLVCKKSLLTAGLLIACSLFLAVQLDSGSPEYGVRRILEVSVSRPSQSGGFDLNRAGSTRLTIWAEYASFILDRWLLGIGEAGHHLIPRSQVFAYHPENILLLFAASWGLPAGLLALGLCCYPIVLAKRCYQAHTGNGAFLITLSVLLYIMFAATIEAGFIRHWDRLIYFSFAGIAIGQQWKLGAVSAPDETPAISAPL